MRGKIKYDPLQTAYMKYSNVTHSVRRFIVRHGKYIMKYRRAMKVPGRRERRLVNIEKGRPLDVANTMLKYWVLMRYIRFTNYSRIKEHTIFMRVVKSSNTLRRLYERKNPKTIY